VLLTRHYYDDQIEEDEMGGACGMHEGEEKCMKHPSVEKSRKETV
jgi:hypothetical protein